MFELEKIQSIERNVVNVRYCKFVSYKTVLYILPRKKTVTKYFPSILSNNNYPYDVQK